MYLGKSRLGKFLDLGKNQPKMYLVPWQRRALELMNSLFLQIQYNSGYSGWPLPCFAFAFHLIPLLLLSSRPCLPPSFPGFPVVSGANAAFSTAAFIAAAFSYLSLFVL
ncbi:hypothetical protein SK128_014886 [Halocaridina rubra]|uniref:Uncharacterized protein n=1 Tax=Halocaridina rubra TaxID=373956 RepID=A0AAN9A0Q4_HALRR